MSPRPLYSVVIPHFNSDGLIERLLHSIPVRADIETIVVDDKSTETVIHEIANSEEFAHVNFIFSKHKLTAGGARNEGLKSAHGKYIVFADSDDVFSHDAFQVFDQHVTKGYDLLQFKFDSFIEENKAPGTRHLYLQKQYAQKGLTRYLSLGSPCAKLVKRSLIDRYQLSFSEVRSANDICFSAKVALLAESKCFVDHIVYRASQRTGSLTQDRSEETEAIRIAEQTKKVQLIRSLTPWYFSLLYLARKNVLYATLAYIRSADKHDPKLVSSSRAYVRNLPWLAKTVYSFSKRLGLV